MVPPSGRRIHISFFPCGIDCIMSSEAPPPSSRQMCGLTFLYSSPILLSLPPRVCIPILLPEGRGENRGGRKEVEEAPEITRFRCQILMVPLSPLSPPRSLSFSMVQRRRSLAYLDEEDPPPPSHILLFSPSS